MALTIFLPKTIKSTQDEEKRREEKYVTIALTNSCEAKPLQNSPNITHRKGKF